MSDIDFKEGVISFSNGDSYPITDNADFVLGWCFGESVANKDYDGIVDIKNHFDVEIVIPYKIPEDKMLVIERI